MTTRIAIIGCGAVAHAHLPVVAASDRAEVTVLCDRALARAQELAAQHGVEHAVADFHDVRGLADAAIVALPHHLHGPVSKALLEAGLHVLVEKPMALTSAECDEMIAAAKASGRALAVGLGSRYLSIATYVKEALERDLIGRIESFDIEEGVIYDWPVASDFMFRRETGGGVLADAGAHVLDLLLHWLGEWTDVTYRDDAAGGVEADCELELALASGVRGTVRLSRTRTLRNTWILRGERGSLEVERRFGATFRWRLAGIDHEVDGRMSKDGAPEDPMVPFHRQLDGFLRAIETGTEPWLSGAEGRRAVALIERCHEVREPMARAWEAFAPPVAAD